MALPRRQTWCSAIATCNNTDVRVGEGSDHQMTYVLGLENERKGLLRVKTNNL